MDQPVDHADYAGPVHRADRRLQSIKSWLPVRRTLSMVWTDLLPYGRRRNLDPVRAPDRFPDAFVYPGVMGFDQGAHHRIHDRLPAAGNPGHRRVHLARPVPVLHLLRRRPRADVPDNRYLGRQGSDLRLLQVLPLYPAGLRANAGRHAVHGGCRRHRRYPGAVSLRLRA